MIRKVVLIGVLALFLISVIAVTPVTASHQKGITEKVSALRDFIEKIAPPQPSCIGFVVILLTIVWIIIQILQGNVYHPPGT